MPYSSSQALRLYPWCRVDKGPYIWGFREPALSPAGAVLYATTYMQRGDDHTTIRDESHDQPDNRAVEDDPPTATDQAASRLGNRYTVREAAKLLGTTVDAVRGRIRRGTMDSLKANGVVYVLLSEASRDYHTDETTSRQGATVGDEAASRGESRGESGLVVELKDQIDWLRREVERKDTIIMSMTQRIPELEAPATTRDAPVSASEKQGGAEVPPEGQGQEKRSSWWRRFFGFENPA